MAALDDKFDKSRRDNAAAGLAHIQTLAQSDRRPERILKVEPLSVSKAVVVGGGAMGSAIAYCLANVNIDVTVLETSRHNCAVTKDTIAQLYRAGVKRGLFSELVSQSLMEKIRTTTEYDELTQSDLAIEAVFENLSLKKQVFAVLDKALDDSAILATNTSYLDINEIASASSNPDRVIGLHFFNPAQMMKLLEIVRGDKTSDVTIATGFALAQRLRKIPVLSGVCDGFIGNRILMRYREAADSMLLEGATPYQIDEAMVEFGYPIGPYETQDIAGLDIAYANRRRQDATRDPKRRYVQISDKMVESGRIGRKVNKGWYRYEDGTGGQRDSEVEKLIAEEAKRCGIKQQTIRHDEIRMRLIAAMVNEACGILAEGIAQSTADIDIVTVYGYGFPKHKGGLMYEADSISSESILESLRQLAQQDPVLWKPCAALNDAVQSGLTFAEYFDHAR